MNPYLKLTSMPSALLRLALVGVLMGAMSGCGSKGGTPTAPVVPDNPDPPVLTFTTDFTPGNSNLNLTFSPQSEDLKIELVNMGVAHAGLGSINPTLSYTPGVVARGGAMVVHVSTAWTWQATDTYWIGVRVSRPGQRLTFGLCCSGCSHSGGTLQAGPC